MPWIIQDIHKRLAGMSQGQQRILALLELQAGSLSGLALPEIHQGMLSYTRNLWLGDLASLRMPTKVYTIQKYCKRSSKLCPFLHMSALSWKDRKEVIKKNRKSLKTAKGSETTAWASGSVKAMFESYTTA